MKRSLRIFGTSALLVFALCAVAAASASANTPRWKVGGAYLGAGVEEAFSSTSGVSKLRVPARGLTLVCKKDSGSGKIVGSAAGSPGTNKEVVVTFEECSVEGAPTCVVPNITTKKLKSELVWLSKEGNNAGDRLLPEEGTVFTNIVISGCAAAGTFPVTGEALGKVEPIATEVTSGTLTFTDPAIATYWTGDKPNRVEHTNGGLKFGGTPAVFSSVDTITLNSGSVFGVFE